MIDNDTQIAFIRQIDQLVHSLHGATEGEAQQVLDQAVATGDSSHLAMARSKTFIQQRDLPTKGR
jgi:hypothetical protein